MKAFFHSILTAALLFAVPAAVADELPDEFIFAIRAVMQQDFPDAYLLGEVWEDGTTKVAYSILS